MERNATIKNNKENCRWTANPQITSMLKKFVEDLQRKLSMNCSYSRESTEYIYIYIYVYILGWRKNDNCFRSITSFCYVVTNDIVSVYINFQIILTNRGFPKIHTITIENELYNLSDFYLVFSLLLKTQDKRS